MKFGMLILVAVLFGGLVGVVQAKDKKPADGAKANKPLVGKIVSVSADGTEVVINAGKHATEVTVTTDPKTIKVTVDGAPAKLTDLQQGEWVEISPAIGVATTIKATTKAPHKAT